MVREALIFIPRQLSLCTNRFIHENRNSLHYFFQIMLELDEGINTMLGLILRFIYIDWHNKENSLILYHTSGNFLDHLQSSDSLGFAFA